MLRALSFHHHLGAAIKVHQAFPRDFVENVGTRANKKRNDGGGAWERRKRLPTNQTIFKNCLRPRTQLLIGAVLVASVDYLALET